MLAGVSNPAPLPVLSPMIQYRLQSASPHLHVDLGGTVSGTEVTRELASLPADLTTVPEGFVGLITYPDLRLIEEEAVGPLFYAVTHLLHARPALCVFVDGGHTLHSGLRSHIKRLARDGQIVFVETEAEATRHIERHETPRRPSSGSAA